ncbi:MAG: FMN-binding protein [Christensenellales bacterium]
MGVWINIIFAWVALILSFLLVVIFILKRALVDKKPHIVFVVNRWLRRRHKLIGLLCIATSLIHGIFSSDSILSLNLGTAAWLLSLLLGLSWLLRNKLGIKKTWVIWHRVLTIALLAVLAVHIINVGGFILDDMIAGRVPCSTQIQQFGEKKCLSNNFGNAEKEPLSSENVGSIPAGPRILTDNTPVPKVAPVYSDGTYTGTGTGYRPGVVIQVVINEGKIATVTVVEHNEKNKMYWGAPVEMIPKAIVKAQSADVDNISGATMTCAGIKEAVKDALCQAMQ